MANEVAHEPPTFVRRYEVNGCGFNCRWSHWMRGVTLACRDHPDGAGAQ